MTIPKIHVTTMRSHTKIARMLISLTLWIATATTLVTAFAIPDISAMNTPALSTTTNAFYRKRFSNRTMFKKRIHAEPTDASQSSSSSGNMAGKATNMSSSYYLISSRKALLQILLSTTLLFVLHALSPSFKKLSYKMNYFLLPSAIPSLAHHSTCHPATLWAQISLPMLSSACCLLQLLLNLFSVGCAGFNSYLGPIRPVFIGVLGYLSILSDPFKHFGQMIVSWGMALLPEWLYIWNKYKPKVSISHHRNEKAIISKRTMTVQLHVPSMGCVACVNKINSSLCSNLQENLNKSKNHSLSTDENMCGSQLDIKVDSWLVDQSKDEGLNLVVKKGGIAQITVEMDYDEEEYLRDQLLNNEMLVKAIEKTGFKDSEIIAWNTETSTNSA